MALNIKEIPQGGGGWFKPAENKDAVAILVEVKGFDRQRPTPNGPKDSALCDITIFKTVDGAPSVHKGMRVEQTVLARDLGDLVGAATIVTVTQVASKKAGAQPAWVWRTVTDGGTKAAVIAYAEKREAELAAAVANAPSFD